MFCMHLYVVWASPPQSRLHFHVVFYRHDIFVCIFTNEARPPVRGACILTCYFERAHRIYAFLRRLMLRPV